MTDPDFAGELREALRAICQHFPTDTDMREAGWCEANVDAACNAYDKARPVLVRALAATPQAAQPAEPVACVCGQPLTLGVVHRQDGPCYRPDAAPAAAPVEPVAWRCDWPPTVDDGDPLNWRQYHDADDPLPETWDDEAPKITPLYAAPAVLRGGAEPATWQEAEALGVRLPTASDPDDYSITLALVEPVSPVKAAVEVEPEAMRWLQEVLSWHEMQVDAARRARWPMTEDQHTRMASLIRAALSGQQNAAADPGTDHG